PLLPGASADHGLWPAASVRSGSGIFFCATARRNRRAARIRPHDSNSRVDARLLQLPNTREEFLRSRRSWKFEYFLSVDHRTCPHSRLGIHAAFSAHQKTL